jgi:23S rRNA (uracil1939-C5)-methyltransferase
MLWNSPFLSYPECMPDTEQLKIETIVAGGDGLARHPDGYVVFVPRTVPGELVEVEYTEIHKQWRRARAVRLLESSPTRRDPSCPHYARCGGCQLQHVAYEAQLPIKAAVVADSLRRIGKIEIEPPDTAASPQEFGYRNRISLVLKSGGDGFRIGYHAFDDPSEIIEIASCPLAEKPINLVLGSLAETWNRLKEHMPSGRELRLTFRVNANGDVGLAIEGSSNPGEPEKLLEAIDGLVSIWLLDRRGDIVNYAGEQMLDEEWGDYVLPLAGTAFIQVNRDVATLIDAYVLDRSGDVTANKIIDAYCGFGLRAFDLARNGALVIGIDQDRHAIRAGKNFIVETGLSARFVCGGVERELKKQLPADLVILNPPRRGLASPVVDTLLRSKVNHIIYISCDPATLARDIKGLSGRYELQSLQTFDLFPQTAHVETVAVLSRQ